jgi:hypothetical protein
MLANLISFGEGLPFTTLFASPIGHRTAKFGLFMLAKLWYSGTNPTHVNHLHNGTCHHTHVLPCLQTTCVLRL